MGLPLALALLFAPGKNSDTVPVTPTVVPSPTATATMTATPIPPTATPSPTSTPVPPTPAPVTYKVTYYGAAFQGGPFYCGTDIYGYYDLNDPTTVAAGAGGPPCGTPLTICNEGACLSVVVKDRCGGCGPYHLDLSKAAWEALGRPSEVEVYGY